MNFLYFDVTMCDAGVTNSLRYDVAFSLVTSTALSSREIQSIIFMSNNWCSQRLFCQIWYTTSRKPRPWEKIEEEEKEEKEEKEKKEKEEKEKEEKEENEEKEEKEEEKKKETLTLLDPPR